MALTGHLSDLSLSELIEFFCNQRKTGRLTVLYPQGPGYFYLQTGSVVDARIGVLRGIDAVYYALTLPNAKFEFSGSAETAERTINQPWTQVVLEGLRRLDEDIVPAEAFTATYVTDQDEIANESQAASGVESQRHPVPAFLSSFIHNESIAKRKPLIIGVVAVALLASVAVVGVPAGWYNRAKALAAASEPANAADAQPQTVSVDPSPTPAAVEVGTQASDAAALARRQRERARILQGKLAAAEAMKNAAGDAPAPSAVDSAKGGPKKVTVTVTYDESGRVTQASGADATAIRIARQKRFPIGKPGSATVTIPIN